MLRLTSRSLAPWALVALCSTACGGHHWARIQTAELPPPRASELHANRLLIDTTRVGDGTQCVVHRDYSPVCFFDLKDELDAALVRATWPAFPGVQLGTQREARPSDYVLQVDVQLDALPPDASGPGWSAGAQTRFRLLRDGKVIHEETLASRSVAEYPYGAPLGPAASSVVDASVRHIAERLASLPETKRVEVPELPHVASRVIPGASTRRTAPSAPPALDPPAAAPAPAALAKSQPPEEPLASPEASEPAVDDSARLTP